MAEPLPGVVCSHARFLEYQDRRRRLAVIAASRAVIPVPEPDARYTHEAGDLPPASAVDSKT